MEKQKKPKINYRKELEEKDKVIQEYKDQLQRVQAEFENYIKRNEKDRKILLEYGARDLLLKLVNIFDDFERAINISNKSNKEELVDGLNIIFNNFEKILKEEGVCKIDCVGEKFNPEIHDVLEKVPSDDNEDKIIEELQKGYKFKDKILRYSKVRVSGGKKNE